MAEGVTVIAGIPVPSTSPVFLAVVALHVLAGLTCVVTGVLATLPIASVYCGPPGP